MKTCGTCAHFERHTLYSFGWCRFPGKFKTGVEKPSKVESDEVVICGEWKPVVSSIDNVEIDKLRARVAELEADARRWREDCAAYEESGLGVAVYWKRGYRTKEEQDTEHDAAINAAAQEERCGVIGRDEK